MDQRPPRSLPTGGEELDPRWRLANERTLLAYERTALGLLVAGLAVAGSGALAQAPLWFSALGIPLIALGAVVALEGRRRFLTAQAAMRAGEPLEAPAVAVFLPWGLVAVATVAMVAAVLHLATGG